MISSLLIRSASLGAIGSLAWLSALTDIPDNPNLNKKTGKYIPPKEAIPKSGSTFEELGIFEKHKGCKFIFVNNLSNAKKTKTGDHEKYTTENVMKEIEKNYSGNINWWKSVAKNVWTYNKNLCQKDKVVTLDGHGNQIKNFK